MIRISNPGLMVSPSAHIRRERLLPVPGRVMVTRGQQVEMADVVALAELPGPIHPIQVARGLGISNDQVPSAMSVHEGDRVEKGQPIARHDSLFGWLHKRIAAPVTGTVGTVSAITGQVLIMESPRPFALTAYLPGQIVNIVPKMGVEIETRVSIVQGIFGFGGEQQGDLLIGNEGIEQAESSTRPESRLQGTVVAIRGMVSASSLRWLQRQGVRAVIAGSASGQELAEFTGHRLNPAETGTIKSPLTVVLTEGFGELAMSDAPFNILSEMEGRRVSVNGVTQVRAGVIRPEVISAPLEPGAPTAGTGPEDRRCNRVRIVRGEAFGKIGQVVSGPDTPLLLATGALALVYEIQLDDHSIIWVPRQNVETIQ